MKKRRGDDIKVGDVFDDLTIIKIYDFSIAHVNRTKKNPTLLRYCRYRCVCGREGNTTCEKFERYKNKGKVNRCPSCAYRTRKQSTIRDSKEMRFYKLSIADRCKKSDGRIKNKLSFDDFKELIVKNCYYCGSEPELKKYIRNNKYAKSEYLYANGLDRINSDGDYELKNVVPCCKKCNSMKGVLKQFGFFKHVKKIYENINLDNLDEDSVISINTLEEEGNGKEYDAWIAEEADEPKENPPKERLKGRKIKQTTKKS